MKHQLQCSSIMLLEYLRNSEGLFLNPGLRVAIFEGTRCRSVKCSVKCKVIHAQYRRAFHACVVKRHTSININGAGVGHTAFLKITLSNKLTHEVFSASHDFHSPNKDILHTGFKCLHRQGGGTKFREPTTWHGNYSGLGAFLQFHVNTECGPCK